MAEYAGLEIRIGGDTTKLNKALKASVGAAAELQREIRLVTNAMRFDPADLGHVATRIKLTSDRMEALRSKVQLAETAMKQLGEKATTVGGAKSIRELAEKTENVAVKAKLADERYNDVVSTIATLYEQFNKVAKNAAFRELPEDVRKVSSATEIANMNAEEFDATMKRWNVPKDVVDRVDSLRNMQFHFEGRTGELEKMVETMEQLGIFTEDDVASVKTLREQFNVISSEKAAYDLADQFQELGVRIERDKAEIQGLSNEIRELDTHSKVAMSDGFSGTKAEIDEVDRAVKTLDDDIKRAQEALKLDPNNLSAAKTVFDDMSQKAELLSKRGELLRENLSRLATPEVKQAAQDHQNLAEWIENSRKAAQDARAEYSQQSAELTNLKTAANNTADTMKLLKSRIDAYDSGVSGHDAFETLTKQVKDAKNALDKELGQWNKMLAKNPDMGGIMPQGVLDRLRVLEDSVRKTESNFSLAGTAVENFETKIAGMHFTSESQFDGVDAELSELKTHLSEAEYNAEKAKEALASFKESNAFEIEWAQKIEDMNVELSKLQKNLNDIDDVRIATPEQYEKWRQELEKLEVEYPELRDEVDKYKQKVDESREAMNRAEGELDLANQTREWKDLTTEVDKNTGAIKENARVMQGEGRGILTASNLKSLGMTMYSTVTPIVSGIGYAMVSASEDIDSAYRDMRKTVEGTEGDFQRLYDAAIEFSNTHVTSAAQLLEIESIGGELGIATENLQAFGETVASLADSTNLSAEDAATALGHLANIMKIEPEQYSGFADALVRLGNNGASTEEEIVNIAERIGSMGSIVGMSTPDVLALASTIASTGQNAEAAGTAISKTMSFMETAVAAAGGTMEVTMESIGAAVAEGGSQLTVFASMSDMTADEFVEAWSSDPEGTFESLSKTIDGAKGSLQMIADVAGMSADDFARAWEEDPTTALEAFIKGLNNIEQSGGSADSTLVNLGITAVRQKQAIEGLMQTVGHLDDNLTMSSDAWNGVSDEWGKAGDAANEAQKKAEGFSGQLQILKNMAQGALASLGEGAVPIMKQLSDILSDLTGWFEGLSVNMKTAVIEAGAFAFALGPGLTIISTFMTSYDNIKKYLVDTTGAFSLVAKASKIGGKAMVDALDGASGSVSGLKALLLTVGAEMKALGSSLLMGAGIAAVGIAIGGLVMHYYKLYQQAKLTREATEGLRDAMSGVTQVVGDYSSSMPGAERTLEEIYEITDGLTQRQADLADSLRLANTEYSNTIGPVEYYAQTIEDLFNKSGRSKEETEHLRFAIEQLNDECGTTYGLNDYGELIDTQTGKVIDNTEAIWDNVEARRAQAVLDYYSDAYGEALANQQDAESTLDALSAEQEALEQDSRRLADTRSAKYRSWQEDVERNKAALEAAQTTYDDASDAVEELERRINDANKTIDENTRAQEEATAAAEEYARRQEIVADDVTGNMKRMSDAVSDDKAFNDMADSLDMLTVSANELDGVDMNRFASSFDGSMADVMSALEDGGVHLTMFRGAMDEAGVSSETLSTMTADAFRAIYDSCGNDINKTAEALTHMQTVMATVDGEQVMFYVGDNGTIYDEQGNIYDLNADLGRIPEEVVTMMYGNNSNALDKARVARAEAEKLDRMSATVSIEANDYASGVISGVAQKLRNLSGSVATVKVKEVKQATGGYNTVPVIPRHAKGYIATGPTLTNQGWIGEDGVEAVTNWATGGAVVPLTNTKYMLPIADAIAEGMSQRGFAGGGTTYNLYVNDARVNDDPAIQAAFIGLMSELQRKGAMNAGRR